MQSHNHGVWVGRGAILVGVILLFSTVVAHAEVYSNISVQADAGQGGSATAQVTSTTNGSTTSVRVEGGETANVNIKESTNVTATGVAVPILYGDDGGGASDGEADMMVTAKGGATVDVNGDEIMVILRPAPGAEGSETTLHMNKADIIAKIAIIDANGDGKPDDMAGDVTGQGAESKKPKEIVVVGSKVRESADIDALFSNSDFGSDPSAVHNETDLVFLAARAIKNDPQAEEVIFGESDVSATYAEEVKLFGLFPITMHSTVNVDAAGRVKVRYPWWSALAAKSDTAADIEAAVTADLSENTMLAGDVDASLALQAHAYTALSNIMKARHDIAMNAIRNMK